LLLLVGCYRLAVHVFCNQLDRDVRHVVSLIRLSRYIHLELATSMKFMIFLGEIAMEEWVL